LRNPFCTLSPLRPIVCYLDLRQGPRFLLARAFAGFRDRKLIGVAAKSITILEPKWLDEILHRNLGEF